MMAAMVNRIIGIMNKWIIAYQYWQIVFCKHTAGLQVEADGRDYVIMQGSSAEEIELAVDTLVQQQKDVWFWMEGDIRQLVQYFMNKYLYIKAAGGLVHKDDDMLLIHRNNHWDMAKGKVEKGETLAEAAVREVEEETGLQGIARGPLAIKTYHIYNIYGDWTLKQTSWYHMQGKDCPMTPQTEEGITEVVWVGREEWRQRLMNSYAMMALIARTV